LNLALSGGRQVDGAIASLFALEQICRSPKIREAQQGGKLTVLFDSSIRTGSDIMKALALGAQAILCGSLFPQFIWFAKKTSRIRHCLVARPWVYGLAISGQAGVEEVIKSVLADLDVTMGLSGYSRLDEIIGKGEAIAIKQKL
jgi:lactate 2-monooxygenase